MRLPWTSIGMQQRSSLQLLPNPRTIVTLIFLFTACACEREERRFSEVAPMSSRPQPPTKTELRPGAPEAPASTAKPVAVPAPDDGPYAENAWAVAEGKRLYTWFNCVGCHSHGGGGMGLPLMDESWIYGSTPQDIHTTIVQGRPNGMPAFAGKLSDQQVWQLVAYVRALGGLLRKDVRPGRNDDMAVRSSEQATRGQKPSSAAKPEKDPPK